MRAILQGLIFAAAFAAVNPAFAQTTEPGGGQPAQALLETHGVADLFEVLESDHIKVRHTASRLTCHFYGGETRITIMTFEGSPRGDDVGCNAESDEQHSITLYATRYTPPITIEQSLADAEAGIRNRFSDARPTPTLLTMASEGLPASIARHFLISVQGEQWITSAIVAQSGEWIIKLRYSAPAPDNDGLMRGQLEAGAIFTLALMDIAP
jgi:hypothetical protein